MAGSQDAADRSQSRWCRRRGSPERDDPHAAGFLGVREADPPRGQSVAANPGHSRDPASATSTTLLASQSRIRGIIQHVLTRSLSGALAAGLADHPSVEDQRDVTDHPREVIEAALVHVVPSKVEAAYARSDLFERRRRLMDDGPLP